jgi:hypothetical protein
MHTYIGKRERTKTRKGLTSLSLSAPFSIARPRLRREGRGSTGGGRRAAEAREGKGKKISRIEGAIATATGRISRCRFAEDEEDEDEDEEDEENEDED